MNEKIYVPPIKIQGIKTKIVPLIKQNIMFNPATTWIEPFMGSGVVGLNILPRQAIFADINPHIIELYKQIQDGRITAGRVRQFLETEGAKLKEFDDDYYYIVRKRFNEFHEPLDFLFLNRSCFNGMIRFNKKYEFNVPYGHKPKRFAKAYVTKIVNQVKHIEKAVKGRDWQFVCQSFEKTISEVPSNSFIYCDPPYIGRHVDYYDSWDEEREYILRDALVQSKQLFMLSTWDNNEYRINEYIEKVWGFCYKINKEHFYHIGAKESNRKPMVEALLTNYEPIEKENSLLRENEQISFELQKQVI